MFIKLIKALAEPAVVVLTILVVDGAAGLVASLVIWWAGGQH